MLSGSSVFVYATNSFIDLPTFHWNKANNYSLAVSVSPVIYQEVPDPYRSLNTSLKVGRIEGSQMYLHLVQLPIKFLLKYLMVLIKCNHKYL